MLAVTFAEKACGEHAIEHLASRNYTKDEITSHLAKYLDSEVWGELKAKLGV